MYSISRLQAILKPVSHGVFQKHVDAHGADRHSKGFGCHDLLIGMVYAQLSGAGSLRSLQGSFNEQVGHHYHLHTRTMQRSTVADALRKRNPQPFADMAAELMRQCSRKLRQCAQQFLFLLDSTPIQLHEQGFDSWRSYNGRIKGLKMHVLMDALTGCPTEARLSAANVNDVSVGRNITITAGATYVFDKGYCDYNWWHQISQAGARFITRAKANAALCVQEQLPVEAPEILSDELVSFTHRHSRAGKRPQTYYGETLRRISVQREGKAPLVLISNDLSASASEIAQLYKQRWQIELLFKWLKQHLKLKTFFGRSQNAVKLQLLCALIAYLLLKLHHKQQDTGQSLWMFLCTIRGALFERPDTTYAMYRRRREKYEEMLKYQGVLL